MSLRKEFVTLATAEGANVRELCRRFAITPRTGYKWLSRYREKGMDGLANLSRRPLHSPSRTSPEVETAVVRVRRNHPAWGGRKSHAWLMTPIIGAALPSASTITAILQRHGLVDPASSCQHKPWQRFEHPAPNELWQMDFKGHFPLAQGRCHPLTVLIPTSRDFAVGLEACPDQRGTTVQERLTSLFRRYGLPYRMVMDNGSPWGSDQDHPYTPLTVWLMRLGIAVSHGRPYHPQTQGKDERFHRTLKAEVLQGRSFRDLPHCQRAFEAWRLVYNLERPHQALGYATPASRYQASPRPFSEQLPSLEYDPDDQVRKVQAAGEIFFHGKIFTVGKAFRGLHVALRPTQEDEVWNVFFLTHPITSVDLRYPDEP
jgi:transposase InsO family protein